MRFGNRYQPALYLFTVFFSTCCCIAIAAENESLSEPPLSLEQIISRLLDQTTRLRSIHAIVRTFPAIGDASSEPEVTMCIAADGARRYQSFWHGSLDLRDQDPRSIAQYFDGREFNVYNYFNRRYEIAEKVVDLSHLKKIQNCVFYECLGWWPSADPHPPSLVDGEPFYLRDILANPNLKLVGTVAPSPGEFSFIVEIPDLLRLWIDSHIWVVTRRQQLARKDGQVIVAADFKMSDFAEYADGIWLPQTIRRSFPNMHAPQSLHRCEIVAVNSVNEELFTFSPPPGTLIFDRDNDELRQVPGGLEVLDVFTKRLLSVFPLTNKSLMFEMIQRTLLLSTFIASGILAHRLIHRRFLPTSIQH